MNSPETKEFIKENSPLFWYIPEEKKQDISHEVLVEFILNYGTVKSVKTLFNLLGINYVADIFDKQTNRQRVNYHKRTAYFFNLYFQRHAHRDT
ncbi:MAG: hypothetical protein DRJ10_09120 [Bacteroidetes bacterium]|nr:MAG: hypothetical protein DRJ10_09120 [Bacteroidota bacterium]